MTELIDTLQNYKQLLRDHQAELAKDLLNGHSSSIDSTEAVANASNFRKLQNGVNAVDEFLYSLQVLA